MIRVLTIVVGSAMVLFIAATTHQAHKDWARDEPNWIVVLSELAIVCTGVLTVLEALEPCSC